MGNKPCIKKTRDKVSSLKPIPGINNVSKNSKFINDNELTALPITVAVTSPKIEHGKIAPVIPVT